MNECNCGQSTNPNGLCDGFGDNICQEIIHENESHRQVLCYKTKYDFITLLIFRWPFIL